MTHNSVLRVLFCWKRPACFHRILCRGNKTGTHFLGSFNLFLNVVFVIGEQNPAKISGALEDCNLCNLEIWGDSLLSGHEGWVQRLPTGEAIANFGKLEPKHVPSPPKLKRGLPLETEDRECSLRRIASLSPDIQTPPEKIFGPPKTYLKHQTPGGMTGCLGHAIPFHCHRYIV